MSYLMTNEDIRNYKKYLCHEERSIGTIEKYLRDINAFFSWLSSVNGFFRFMGWEECRVKFLHIQRKMFRKQAKELDRKEYMRLLNTAQQQGKERLCLLMETICSTGIRVSKVKYITIEAILNGRTDIALKGKIRTVLPDCRYFLYKPLSGHIKTQLLY